MTRSVKCTRRLEFDAGHRVTGHESKCRHPHGHRYAVELTCEGQTDAVGRVIDFGVLKSIVGQWIDDRLDHGYLMHPDDLIGQHIRDQGFKVYAMPVDLGEPTAENLARLVLREATRLLAEHPVVVRHVRVFETPNCWADVEQEA